MIRVHDLDELRRVVRRRKIEVLSVDFFDTLAYRTVEEPSGVFRLQFARAVRHQNSISCEHWVALRKECERAVAARCFPGEVKLADVYTEISARLGLDEPTTSALHDSELAEEREAIHIYGDLASFLNELQHNGVSVVITTDTYLPEALVRSLITPLIPGAQILCSSETGLPKRRGRGYHALKTRYPGKRILHIGDNFKVDYLRARLAGIWAMHVRWERIRWLEQNPECFAFLRELRIAGIPSPVTGVGTSDNSEESAIRQIAFSWACVLTDFLLRMRDYAAEIDATDIWFLSRDTEAMFAIARQMPSIVGDRNISYVYSSRSACYPLVARHQHLFTKWRGRRPTDDDVKQGDAAQDYYRSMLRPGSKRILIVDIGWKGRVQRAIESALPKQVSVFGYYFSLEPGAEMQTVDRSGVFIPWGMIGFNRALIEALSGYSGPSCSHFESEAGIARPVFKPGNHDQAPPIYCAALVDYMLAFAQGMTWQRTLKRAGHRRTPGIVRNLCFWPSRSVARAFHHWFVSVRLDNDDRISLALARGGGIFNRLTCRAVEGNPWPFGSIWTLSPNQAIGRVLQSFGFLAHAARSAMKLSALLISRQHRPRFERRLGTAAKTARSTRVNG
jgi:FMN phosphatase YigB (HAD superfamily)